MHSTPDIKSYVRSLDKNELFYILSKCNYGIAEGLPGKRPNFALPGDLHDACEFFSHSKDRDIDKWISSAENHERFYKAMDILAEHVIAEDERRLQEWRRKEKIEKAEKAEVAA